MHRHLEPADPAARDGGGVARRQVGERDPEEVVDARPHRSGVEPEEVGRAGVPVAQPKVAVEAEDRIRKACGELGKSVVRFLGAAARAAASATTWPATSAAMPISSSTEPSRSASRPTAPAASSAALVDRRPMDRTAATATSTAAAPSRIGAIGVNSAAVAGKTVRSAAASAAAMTPTAAQISRDGPAGSGEAP